MKNNSLKKLTIILLILLISIISFVGVYAQKLNRMENVMPKYKIGMDFGKIHEVRLSVDRSTNTKYYDADGNEVDEPSEETEGITSKKVAVNPEEVLTAENFAKVKEIMTKRLDSIGASEYNFRQDENGYIVIDFPDEDEVQDYVQTIYQTGKFEIVDSQTNEVLIDNSMIKQAFATTYQDSTGAITIYLVINFNDEGKAKLTEVSSTYVSTTDEEGNTTTKNVKINLNDETIRNTYFGQTIETGQLQLSIGNSSTDKDTLAGYLHDATIIASVLRYGNLPITYSIGYENIFSSVLRQEVIQILAIAVAILLVAAVAFMIIKYDKGIFMGISWLGFISTFLLLLRFTNSMLTMNSVIAIIIICIFDFIFLCELLSKKNSQTFNEKLKKYCIIGIPMCLIAIVFAFANVVTISSFGIALFWGLALMVAYNFVITKNLRDEE